MTHRHYKLEFIFQDAKRPPKEAVVERLGDHPYPRAIAQALAVNYLSREQAEKAYYKVKKALEQFASNLLKSREAWTDGETPKNITVLIHSLDGTFQKRSIDLFKVHGKHDTTHDNCENGVC